MPRIDHRPLPDPVAPEPAAPGLPAAVEEAPTMRTDAGLARLLSAGDARPQPRAPDSAAPPSEAALRASLAGLSAAALEAGTRTPKSDGPEGADPMLSPLHERRIRALTSAASPEVASALASDLARIDGPAAPLARALYLKAAAARAGALGGAGGGAERAAALATLAAFAARLDGMERQDLRARASVLDLDSRISTSALDPTALDELRGVTRAAALDGDTRADNDGLFQRFLGSCGTAVLQMALCEDDPVRAFVVHDAGLHSTAASDVVGAFQAELLGEHKGAALSRAVKYDLARVRNVVGRLRGQGAVAPEEAKALVRWLEKGAEAAPPPAAARALEAVRAAQQGFPNEADLRAIAADPIRGDDGLTLEDLHVSIDRHLGAVTGRRYDLLSNPDGLTKPEMREHLERVTAALAQGLDVPFGIENPGHYMLLSAVRGEGRERSFLVSDPWNGITAWVAERDLASGRFTVEPFDQSSADSPGYIDSFYVPALEEPA